MISVILNVYNGEQYIKRCIDSILGQTYKDYELLVIDDGSTDSTARILDEYAVIYEKLKVYHTENKGVGGSRLYGLSKVKGEYMISIDSDDWVESTWLEQLHAAIVNQNADMAICDYYEEHEGRKKMVEIAEHEKVSDFTKDMIHGRTWAVLWNKLIKTSLVKDKEIKFLEQLRYWEDIPFVVSYSLYCQKIAYVHIPLYHYVKTNNESLTAIEKNQIPFNQCRVKAVEMIEEHLRKSGMQNVFVNDMLWIKYWIKDQFILHVVTKERMKLWHTSFPEVNKDWRLLIGKFSLKYWALEHGFDWYVLMNGKYWQLRHKIKAFLKNGK